MLNEVPGFNQGTEAVRIKKISSAGEEAGSNWHLELCIRDVWSKLFHEGIK